MRALIGGALAALFLASPLAAQYDNPGVFISPTTGTYTTASQSVRITWTHEHSLLSTSRVVTLNGANVTGTFNYQTQTGYADGSGVRAVSTGSVTLNPGANILAATICGGGGGTGCTTEEVLLTYAAPPPPAQRAGPVVNTAPHHGGYANFLRYGSTLSYTTPAYVSLDQERAVTLYYSSQAANSQPFIQFDVTDPSLEPAQQFSVRVLYGTVAQPLSNGSTVAYFSNQGGTPGGTVRLGVQVQAGTIVTGAYAVTLEVTSHWPVGSLSSSHGIRVLTMNRVGSPYGAGWGVQGLKRIHVQTDGLMMDEGDGSLRFFAGTGPSFTTPQGDFSTLARTTAGTYQRTWPDGAGALFSGTGQLLHAYTAMGDTTRYEYTGERLTRIVDPAGQAVVLDYNTANYLAGITTPGGRRSALSYSIADVAGVTEPDGTPALQQMTYSGGHRLDAWKDRAGGQWNVQYEAGGAVTVTAPQVTLNGSQPHRPATRVVPEKSRLVAASGQGTAASPMPRVTADSVYASVTDTRGVATRTWLDRYGEPLKVVGPLGHAVTWERNLHGQPVRVTQGSGVAVDLDWNTDGSLARSFDESRGLQADYGYQLLNGVSFLSRSSQGRADVEYDRGTRGEVLRVRVGPDTVARYTYDTRLRVKTVTDRAGHVVEYFYDGSAWKNADSVRTASPAGVQRSAYTYDAHGRPATVTDPAGTTSTMTFDALNRLRKHRAPGDSVLYGFDARGLAQVTDAAGRVYGFSRNALGWLESESDPGGRVSSYRYDAGGNVVGNTDRMGRTFSMRYDAVGRLDSLATPDVGTIRYGYDNPGGWWVWSERVGESRDTLYMDGSGQVYSAVSVMDGRRYEVQSTYREDGLRSQVAVRAGSPWAVAWQEVMNYGYDTRRRLATLTDPTAYTTTTVTYNTEGLPGSIAWPNASATLTLGYTPRHRIGSVQYSRPALNTGLGAGTLAYDILDRLQTRTSTDGKRVTQYGYDPLGRLSSRDESKQVYVPPPPFCSGSVSEPECQGSYDWAAIRNETFGYDVVGNRTGWTYSDSSGVSRNGTAAIHPQGPGNRYGTYAGWTLSYDSVGNLLSRTDGSQTYQYQWNSLGQLTGASTPTVGWIYYGYNGFGVRVRRTTAAGVTTRYLYDGDDLVAEVDASGNRIRTYTYWPGIDQPHSMRTWENGAGGTVHYYALDLPTNTVRGLFGTSGAITHSYQYSAFGEKLKQSEGTHNPLRFAARELDWQTGLYYVRARWYDPFLGRFLSEDPIGLEGGINQYTYAANDPINRRDPTGMIPCTAYWVQMGGLINDAMLLVSDGCDADDANAGRRSGRYDDGSGPRRPQGGHPWPLTIQERLRLDCISQGWLSPEAQALHGSVRYMTGNLGRLYNDPAAQAVTVSESTVIISAGPRGALRNHGARTLAFIVGHELGHIVQFRSYGEVRMSELWNGNQATQDMLENEADLFAYQHVKRSGPTCPMEN
jgi:RHS repeat-associated protein